MVPDGSPISLALPSDLRLLPVVRTFMDAACRTGHLDAESSEAIALAVHEAASNVIRHAHRNQPGARLQIDCYLLSDRMEIHILDEGEPFDLGAVPKLDPTELRLGGRGVFLMRTLMDELSCRPRKDRGNILRMVKLLAPTSQFRDCI